MKTWRASFLFTITAVHDSLNSSRERIGFYLQRTQPLLDFRSNSNHIQPMLIHMIASLANPPTIESNLKNKSFWEVSDYRLKWVLRKNLPLSHQCPKPAENLGKFLRNISTRVALKIRNIFLPSVPRTLPYPASSSSSSSSFSSSSSSSCSKHLK